MVVVDPLSPISAWGLAQNWRPSSQSGGSPGASDLALLVVLMISSQAGGDAVSLAWPASAVGLNLYSTDAFTQQVPWIPVTNTPVLSSNKWVVNVSPLANRACFYRLQSANSP